MRVDLTSLRLFMAAAEDGNFSKAAEREHIAPSAVSKRIHELELELGAPLFRRHVRGVELLPAGEALLRHARSLFALLDRVREEIGEHGSGVRGHVRVAANTSAIVQFLPEALAAYGQAQPHVRIDVLEQTSARALRSVRDGVADLAVVAEALELDGLTMFPFREDRLVVTMPEGHALAGRPTLRFAELLDWPHVTLHEGTSLNGLLTDAARRLGRTLDVRVRVTNFEALRRLVQVGLGIGIVPAGCIEPYRRTMSLASVALDEEWSRRSLKVVSRPTNLLSAPSRSLLLHLTATPASPVRRIVA